MSFSEVCAAPAVMWAESPVMCLVMFQLTLIAAALLVIARPVQVIKTTYRDVAYELHCLGNVIVRAWDEHRYVVYSRRAVRIRPPRRQWLRSYRPRHARTQNA